MRIQAFCLFLAAPILLPGQTAVPQEPQSPTAIIRGHVYVKETDAPLKDARLSLNLYGNPSERLTAVTNAEGLFEFRNVRPGRYQLNAQRDGFITLTYGQDSDTRINIWITVREGQELTGVDLRMSRGGAITGTVYDEAGEPLAGVQVRAWWPVFARLQPQLMGYGSGGISDDRGRYRLFGLFPGRFYVQASLEKPVLAGGKRKYTQVFYPQASAFKDAQAVDLQGGGEVGGIDFQLRSAPTYSVSGQVLDESGRPAARGRVSAVYADAVFMNRPSAAAEVPLEDGTFRLQGLSSGNYLLVVSLNGRSGVQEIPSKAFTVEGANLVGLVAHLGRLPVVRGRVVAVDGPAPASVAGLHAMLRRKGEQKAIATGSRTEGIVGEDGRFEVRNLQPGDYSLTLVRLPPPVTVAGPPFFVSQIRVQGQDVIEQGITLAEGATTEIEVVLDYACGTVNGRLLDENGAPAQAAVVMFAADAAKRESERYFRLTTSDQNGQFAITGVIPGDYLILPFPGRGVWRAEDPPLAAQLLPHAARINVGRSMVTTQNLVLTPEIRRILAAFPF